MRLRRLPPAGERLLPAARAALRSGGEAGDLGRALADRLGARRVDLYTSGREALRRALAEWAARSGRREVVVPAYTCFSVPSAVVAAGLRLRLVDVTPEGWIDPERLAELPLERAAAVVVCNLFGIAEPVAAVQSLARQAGAALIDDAAQALGARSAEGPAGGRGDVGVLSFGRGKPLACLGGGALAWRRDPPKSAGGAAPGEPDRPGALLRALAHDAVLSPWVFPWVAALPWLHVGESRFEPRFAGGTIAASALALGLGALPRHEAALGARRARVEPLVAELRRRTGFRPLAPGPGEVGAFPRLALVAPSPGARDAALAGLAHLGASALYPSALDAVPALEGHRVEREPHPQAWELAGRLLTLPSHSRLDPSRREEVVRLLERL